MLIEIPDFYLHDVEESGSKFMDKYSELIPGCADRYIYAKKIVEQNKGEELVQFIAEMLLAYDALKYKDCPLIGSSFQS